MSNHSLPIFFMEHGRYYTPQSIHRIDTMPFIDHPDLPGLIDILSRKNSHHAILQCHLTAKMRIAFIESLLIELQNKSTPATLRSANLYYLNIKNEIMTNEIKTDYAKALILLRERLDQFDHHLIIATSNDYFVEEMTLLLSHPKCHVILFAPHANFQMKMEIKKYFSTLKLALPKESDITNLLKQHRVELENFHDVFIPEELLSYAYGMTERYLSTIDTFENSLLLLDSSAARACTEHPLSKTESLKPVLTTETLNCVLSAQTKIETAFLRPSYFNILAFTEGMQASLLAQEPAIHAIGKQLQAAHLCLRKRNEPLCHFLFLGQPHSGKKRAAASLATQLFGATHMFYVARITVNDKAILHLTIKNNDRERYRLEEVIREKPYAIIFFENIDSASPTLLSEIEEILKEGELYNDQQISIHFHQAILIFGTSMGADHLANLTITYSQPTETNTIDFMQLVMKENQASQQTYAQQAADLAEVMSPILATALPIRLVQAAHIVPFIPPQKSSIERILRQQFENLSSLIEKQYGVLLEYAPEVIRYLTHTICLQQQKTSNNLTIRQAIREAQSIIEKTMHTQARHSKHDKLLLQLNETGHALRCEWQTSMTMGQHTS